MTPERWQELERVLDEALEHEPHEWPALLEVACAGDPELHAEAELLLRRYPRARHFLETPAPELVANPPPAPTVTFDGRRIGPHRIIREIARGGMGRVLLAERDDGEFRQLVAIKLLRPGLESEDVERRFRVERQILAALDHPHIARLLDGGVTDEGQPYLAMEYIEGVPIDRYCDEHRLPIDARLRLFLTVCEAVQHAHRSLVVHRDLKPANILVTDEGRVKLLDFGIAKLLDDEAAPLTLPVTQAGQHWLTPEYSAPEQIRGGVVTTATDVYQLGVVLFELFTGRRPFERDGRSLHQVEQAVLEQEPETPSAIVTRQTERRAHEEGGRLDPEQVSRARSTRPERLEKLLRGDLDAIVLQALRKEPELRYASADALGEDIKRFLAGQPVAARGGTTMYRARKFMHRHRGGIAAGAGALLLLLSFAGAMGVQANRIARERDRAERATEFLVSLFKEFEPGETPGTTVTTKEILDRGVERIRRELADQPLLQARLLDAIGQVYQFRSFFTEAEELLEEALTMRLRILGPDHLEVAESQHHLGVLRYNMGNYETDSLFRAAIATYRQRLGPGHPRLGYALADHGIALRYRREYAAAESLFREVIAARETSPGPAPGAVATALTYLGKLLVLKGEYAEAEESIREALALRRAQYGTEHPVVANTLDALGELQRERGEYAAAEETFREVLAMRRRLFGAGGTQDVAASYLNLGMLRHVQGDQDEAERLLLESLAGYRHTFGESHDVANVLQRLADVHTTRGNPALAEPLLREALRIRQQDLPEGRLQLAEVQGQLGHSLTLLARYADAESHLREAYVTLRELAGLTDTRTRESLRRLIALYEGWGRHEQAAAYRAMTAQ